MLGFKNLRIRRQHDRRHRTSSPHIQAPVRAEPAKMQRPHCAGSLECNTFRIGANRFARPLPPDHSGHLHQSHGINPKTVAKWKKRESTMDRRTGPMVPRSTVLTVEQEAIIVAFRKTLCCRSTTVFMPYRSRSRSSLVRRCIVVWSVMASAGCLTSKATNPRGRSSIPIRSASSTSIWPR